jgi:hypothetical protein
MARTTACNVRAAREKFRSAKSGYSSELRPKRPQFHILDRSAGELPAMAARNSVWRGRQIGPVQSDARLGTSDEPVQALARRTGQQGSRRARQTMGALAVRQNPVQRSRPSQRFGGSISHPGESNKMLARKQGTGPASMGTECASRAQFYEGGRLWLSNLSTC